MRLFVLALCCALVANAIKRPHTRRRAVANGAVATQYQYFTLLSDTPTGVVSLDVRFVERRDVALLLLHKH